MSAQPGPDLVTVDGTPIPRLGALRVPPTRPSSGALSPATDPSTPAAAPSAHDRALAEAARTGRRVEIVQERSESSTVFANPDGTYTAQLASAPVRARAAGGWLPVDTRLVVKDGVVRPKSVPGKVTLPGGGGEPLAFGGKDGGGVTLDVGGNLPKPAIAGDTATYAGVFDGADLAVQATTVGTEISVVIPERGAGRPRYELPMGFDGLTPVQDGTGGLVLRDAGGAVAGYTTAPVMFDATPTTVPGVAAHRGEVTAKLERRGGGYVMVVTPDQAFLEDPKTVYPVTIDPSTSFTLVFDTFVDQLHPTASHAGEDRLFAGTTPLTGPVRSFLQWNTAPIEGKNVSAATLRLYQVWSGAGGCTASPLTVQGSAHIGASITWNTQPARDGVTWGSANTAGDETACPAQVGHKQLNITGLAAKWAGEAGTLGNLAVLASETNSTHAKSFYSGETGLGTPLLDVTYFTTPGTPTELSYQGNPVVDTLRPVFSARFPGGDPQNRIGRFSLRDSTNTEIASHNVSVAQNATAGWTVPDDVLEPGKAYTWQVRSCAGPAGAETYCSATVTSPFAVNPRLGAGDRPFFTYTGTAVTDRSSVRVNVASGSLVLHATDLSIAGAGLPLTLDRTYNSFNPDSGMLGRGWSGSYTDTVYLSEWPGGSFTFHGESGEVSLIKKNSSGGWDPSGDLDASFVDAGGFGVYALTFRHDRGRYKAGDALYFYNTGPRKGKLHSYVESHGRGNGVTYNGDNIPTQVVDTKSRPVNYTVSGGRLELLNDPNGARTVDYGYTTAPSGAVKLTSVVDAEGNTTAYGYDSSDRLNRITDPEGGEIRIAYDGENRVTSLTREMGAADFVTTFAYTDNLPGAGNDQTVVTDANGHETTYRYDSGNRVTSVTNAKAQTENTTFDTNSNVTEVTDAAGEATTFAYDTTRNNPTSAQIPTGAQWTATYDTGGPGIVPFRPRTDTDPQTRRRTHTWNANGDLRQSVNQLATENTVSATYHGLDGASCAGAQEGQVCRTTNARGQTTDFTYTGGDLTGVNHGPAQLGDVEITYDAVSRPANVDDGKNQDRSFTYDKLDRVKTVTDYDGFVTSYSYDRNGNVKSRTDRAGSWTFTYDGDNRLTSSAGPGTDDVSYTYDRKGNVTSVTDPLGGTTEYEYTTIDEVDVVRDPQGKETTYTYHADHRGWREVVRYPSGVEQRLAYDSSGRVTSIEAYSPADVQLTNYDYLFTSGGTDRALRQRETTHNGVTNYTYDNANRLTTADYTDSPGGAPAVADLSFTYDGNHNRRTSTRNGTPTTFGYNTADQLNTGGATYDANGNMTASTAYGVAAAGYNATDQTTSLTPAGGPARAQSFAGTAQSQWHTSGGDSFVTAGTIGITAVDRPSGDVTFVRDPGGNLVSMRQGGQTYHYVFDGRGSVVGLTDSSGALVSTYIYEPYGRRAHATGTLFNPFQYDAGYTIDGAGTLYKFGTRFYDANNANWTQVDPLPNQPRYAFVNGDPVNHSDPSGAIDINIDVGPIEIDEDLEFDLSWGCVAGALGTVSAIGAAAAAAPMSFGASLAAAGGISAAAIGTADTCTE
ncbi:DNRLRE domain-containing protein [Phytohabitans sp. LJ34]|uniref:DNRLRE domain-containing protein n=1 Tax=Phytohabitans sp. LJ34 TaxID=3452217 RepID=UPI003F8B592C